MIPLQPSGGTNSTLVLRPYQHTGVQWMHEHPRSINADDVGLGKSIQAIEAMTLPALIIAPNYLTRQWFDLLCSSMPNHSISMPEGARKQRTRELAVPANVTVCNIEMLRSYYTDFVAQNYETVVFDEAHHLRKRNATQSENAAMLARRIPRAYLLTASPYYGRVDDVWHLLHIIAPKVFPSYWDFLREWCAVNWAAPYTPKIYGIKPRLRDAWSTHIAPYMLARKYTDVGRQLPPLVEQVVTFNLPPTLQAYYTTLRNKWRLGKQPLESAGAVTVLLRQITMCPAKIAAVGSILEDVPPHEPVMLYTWYKESATLLYEAFGSTARTLLLTGDTDANERAKLLAQASTNGVKYIIATQGALSEGANLQWIRYVVYAEEQYVAEAHRQTLARFQRDRGDNNSSDSDIDIAPVIAYYVRARRTIDETVARARLRGAASIADVARSLLADDD